MIPKASRATLAACAALSLAALAACSSDADKAASALPGVMASLGLERLSFAKASQPAPGSVAITDATGDLRGKGEVKLAELLADHLSGDAREWHADSVTATKVTGAVRAERIRIDHPSLSNGSTGFAYVEADGVEASLLGVPFKAARASSRKSEMGGTAYSATGLRAMDAGALPEMLALLAGADWDVDAVVRDDLPGRVGLEVRKARSSMGDVRAAASIILPPGKDVSYLDGMTARDLLDPSRWPEGCMLRALEVTASLAETPKGLPGPDGVEDERTRSMLAAIAGVTGPARWVASVVPRQPLPMRELGTIMRLPRSADDMRLEIARTPVSSIGQPTR